MPIIESLLPNKRTLSRVRRLFDRVVSHRRSGTPASNAPNDGEDDDDGVDDLVFTTTDTTNKPDETSAGTVLVLDSHGEFIWRRGHRSLSATELHRICETAASSSVSGNDDDVEAHQCQNSADRRRRRFTTNNYAHHRPLMHLRRCCRLWAQLRRPQRRDVGDDEATITAAHNSSVPHCVGGGGGSTIRAQVALQRLLGCQQRMSELRRTIQAHAQYRRRMIGRYRCTGGLRYKVTQVLATRYADEACAEMEALQAHYWQRLRRTAVADLQLPWSSMMLAHHGRLMRRIVRDLRELEAKEDY